tara:strand:+ start:362 stop:463 length:102 start_codon:yes stop_codon:yes gene_type:complete
MKKIFEKEIKKEMNWLGSAILIFVFLLTLKLIY